ncbi:glucose-6-phosphate isomerase [Candidatus Pelagibacter sp.]|nr:glucose-6-phosphate isomerase [Candidatus Pelagibacter sp.]
MKNLLKENNQIICSLQSTYKNKYDLKKILKIKNKLEIRIIGMGGSILGAKAIYNFLRVRKKILFVDNLNSRLNLKKKNYFNLIISKSGNTMETIANSNLLLKKRDKNIFITENKKSYLYNLAKKLNSEIVEHNNFIGGRYSVLSEVGMLPAELMGLNPKKFRQLNNLIKNKKFINMLISNVSSILSYSKDKKFNSIIVNYDPSLSDFLEWYKQLVSESLGKKGKGILPIISNMPKDNHSTMQLYLDGTKNNFFTFFYSEDNQSNKINKKNLLKDFKFLKNKTINQIMYSQKLATEKVFNKKKIPFRSFEISKFDEKTLGELFCFFILETILLGKSLNLNPYDQPSVELIKKETKRLLI